MSPSRGEITTRWSGGVCILELPVTVVADLEGPVSAATEQALASATTLLVFDFSSVEYMNSAGIGAIVVALHRTRESSLPVRLAGVSGQPLTALEYSGLSRYVPVYGSIQEALAGL